MKTNKPAWRRVLYLIGQLGPVPDVALEKLLAASLQIAPSTVRGARKKLVRAGVVRRARGRTRDGRRRWEVVPAEERM